MKSQTTNSTPLKIIKKKKEKTSSHTKIFKDLQNLTENDKVWMAYIFLLIGLVGWSTVYITKKKGWWIGLNEKVPGWGNSQLLIIMLIFAWCCCFTYTNYKLSYILEGDAINLMHFTFVINIILIASFFFSLSDGVGNYKETSYIITISVFTGLFCFYQSYINKNNILKLISGLGLIIIIYLDAWSWTLAKN